MTDAQASRSFHLAPLTLSGIGARRDFPKSLSAQEEQAYEQTYDFHTFAYDSFFDSDKKCLTIVCPKLFNFKTFIQRSLILVDGRRLKFHTKKYARYDTLEAKLSHSPSEIVLRGSTQDAVSNVSLTDQSFFAGRNVLVTLSKNNSLQWVHDWAEHHALNQAADAVLFIDNGTTKYGIDEVAATLCSVHGLKRIGVISAHFAYGPVRSVEGRVGSKARFLQPAMLNLVRMRFLQEARAALLIDVDELVNGVDRESIFDATYRSPLRYLPIGGRWFDTRPEKFGCARHSDHTIARYDMGSCPSKYCIVPKSFLGNMSWSVHKIEPQFAKLIPASRSFYYSHLIRITDNWKGRLHHK